MKVAQAGKHLLCEKPCGTSLDQVEKIVSACEQAGVQFMDGVMFMHSERLNKVREAIDDGTTIGKLRRINTQFSFCAPDEFLTENIRMHSDLEPHGCLGRLGMVYDSFHPLGDAICHPQSSYGSFFNSSGGRIVQTRFPQNLPGNYFSKMSQLHSTVRS